ncbi:MAG: AAA family ATPase [Bdellovibrionaceae bacterium]|nr:AAA family ATPase [Pseudobdellovibrionaceae bacterium]
MKLISVTSGKGGVGKTTVTCNLAMSLAAAGHRVLIFDGDIGMANVDIFFGVRAKYNIKDLLGGESIHNCITKLVKNIDLLAGGSGLQELMSISAFERREIIQQIQSIHLNYDYVIIDTAPGLHDYVLHLNAVADQCVLLITQDPSSFADAYALIKTLNAKYKMKNFQVVCNLVDESNGGALFVRFAEVVEKFLTLRLSYLGTITEDAVLKKAQQMQRLIMRQGIYSKAQKQIQEISVKLIDTLETQKPVRQTIGTLELDSEATLGLGGIFFPASGHA